MSAKAKGVGTTVAILLALGALFTGLFVSQHLHTEKQFDVTQFNGTYLDSSRAVNTFALTGIDDKVFNNSSLKGQWTLMFFGFTSCATLCPTTLAELAKMYRILEHKKIKQLPNVVMVSIDPERDTLDKLSQYMSAFHSNFYAARGPEDDVKAMTTEMGIAYEKVANGDANSPNNYDVQHSGTVMLFNPQGELTAFFTTPHHADLLAKDYILLVS
jgi:protein SCO1/2